METAVITAIITSSAAVVGPILTYYATKGRSVTSTLTVSKLNSRFDVYENASTLIKDGHLILDTSWGSDEANLTNIEKQACDQYLKAKRLAIARKSTTYRELFTLTNNTERSARYENAITAAQRQPGYLAMLLEGINPFFPLIDFLVVDGKHVILSLLSYGTARTGHQYLYMQSPEVAELLTDYFDACWQYGGMQEKESI